MNDGERKFNGSDRSKKRYRSDGTSAWGKRSIDGPGVWVSCVKGKEKQTVGELYDLFESLASELWPEDVPGTHAQKEDGQEGDSDDDMDEDLEKQIARELASMKKPRTERRFANCLTNTPCVVFISCRPPVNPVELVLKHIENVSDTGVTNTKYTQRLIPVVNTCVANVPEIKSLFQRVLKKFLAADVGDVYRYKIELRTRNHSTLSRQQIIDTIVECVPSGYTVDLEDAELFILVEVFKSVCGISIVKDYYAHQKFNVMEIANLKNGQGKFEEGRVAGKGVIIGDSQTEVNT
ncbi:hypothetical protein BV25DRAFT_1909099 [Artomyces pyxidatus]|uniref:Uncharacterized protein n=1 Tax=Artomyces pyxidatus TaxID=48021 RepID=A0ACB8SSG3_9AGAM|nr:hypothetical protein BV25DRAFT_1909099 [Artomyces pyxidatus]